MKVGELFVQLGVKGGEGAKKAVSGVKNALVDVKNSSLETKAAIVGVVYGLERMMNWSMKMGTGLAQFAHLTGMSAEALQRWQYAGRQANVTNESVEQSFKGLQRAISDQMLGRGKIEGLGMLADSVGFDIGRAEKDIQYAMGQLQKYALKNKGAMANSVLASFGVNDDMIAGFRQAAFTKERMAKAPIFNNKDIDALAKMNAEFENMFHKFKMATGKFFAEEGGQIIASLTKMADAVLKLVEAMYSFAKSVGLFDKVASAIETMANGFRGFEEMKKRPGEMLGSLKEMVGLGGPKPSAEILAPRPRGASGGGNKETNFNQTLVFKNDGSNAQEVKSSVKDAVENAFRQMSAQGVNN